MKTRNDMIKYPQFFLCSELSSWHIFIQFEKSRQISFRQRYLECLTLVLEDICVTKRRL